MVGMCETKAPELDVRLTDGQAQCVGLGAGYHVVGSKPKEK